MGKPVKFDPGIVDYYKMFDLVRGQDRRVLLDQLRDRQGELTEQMSGGALNKGAMMEELVEENNHIIEAIRVFKSQERLEKYNAQLDAAYASGAIDIAAQEAAMSAWEEIEKLFIKGKYAAVINMCRNAIMNQGANAKLYDWLARSYHMNGQGTEAIGAVEEFIRAFPNDANALDLGVRYHVMIGNHIEKAQEYANVITEKYAGSPLAVVDQIYIHLAQKNIQMAFNTIDGYIAIHPTDEEFRQNVAYDLIGFSSMLYKHVDYEGSDIAYLTSSEDYELCKKMADKARSVYNSKEIRDFCEYTDYMGEVRFNEDNKSNIIMGGIAAAIYAVVGIMCVAEGPLIAILVIALAAVCAYVTVKLYKVSKRPYWQIYKYELTGEREPEEKRYITIGNILGGYMRWGWRIGWKIAMWAFRLGAGGF